MQLNRPANAPAYDKSFRQIEPAQEPVTIKAGLVLGLDQINDKKQENYHNFDNVALVSCLLGSFKEFKA